MEGLEGKRITIFYNDGESVSRKDGICTAEYSNYLCLDGRILIPHDRVVRVEVVQND